MSGDRTHIKAMVLREKVDVANAMIAHGGSFVSALGEALLRADVTNAVTIYVAFPAYWNEYRGIAESEQ